MELNSTVTEFILLGLTQDILKEKLVFVIFLFLYLATLFVNLFIVMTIRYSRMLGGPMYFFLFYLSFADACYSTTTVPRLILHAISKNVISYNERMAQIFAGHFFGCMEIFVLILMSFDRYVAICKPLQYTTIMSQHVCGALLNLAWVGSCNHSLVQVFLVLKLPFCGPNVIDHYFCDMQPLLKLACMDTYVINLLTVFNSGAICIVSFIVLIISYVFILHSLSKRVQKEERKPSLPASPTLLLSSYSLFRVYSHTVARLSHFQWTRW
ncbi:olfactory receptor 4C11-like [Elephas maximus indicus]|uniref:olfactory receptor 4C11-like n=1 Tax=Elephas maximus indicus TaxID=99487 RepID=UPI0021170F12|nr:olfactory receptor 4C11-like [Elephas maximus indicus]